MNTELINLAKHIENHTEGGISNMIGVVNAGYGYQFLVEGETHIALQLNDIVHDHVKSNAIGRFDKVLAAIRTSDNAAYIITIENRHFYIYHFVSGHGIISVIEQNSYMCALIFCVEMLKNEIHST